MRNGECGIANGEGVGGTGFLPVRRDLTIDWRIVPAGSEPRLLRSEIAIHYSAFTILVHSPFTPKELMFRMCQLHFPPGTPVCVRQTVRRRGRSYEAEVVGTVEAWEDLPTGSWFAHGRQAKLWLKRLKLRKVDDEVTLLVIDDSTAIAKLEAKASVDCGLSIVE